MLDYKDRYILNLLITSNRILNILDLSRLLSISKRSVYYSISRINDYLKESKLPEIRNTRDKGIVVHEDVKLRLKEDLNKELQDYYLCTQTERNAIEILFILFRREDATINHFEEIFKVSRNTILADIKEVKSMLSIYNLELQYNYHNGYIVEGTSIRKRSVALMIISSYEYLLKINTYGLFDEEVATATLDKFREVEEQLKIKYVHKALEYISEMLAMLITYPIEPIKFFDNDKDQIEETKEYKVINEIFFEKKFQSEKYYITLQLLGMRIQNNPGDSMYDNDEVLEIVEYLIEEFSKETLIYFDDEKGLFENLYLHMKQALFRFKYGLIFQNELKQEIFENYPQITNVTKKICNNLEKKLGYPIGDDDVAYITMHFGGYLKREKREIPLVKVLLVCLNGLATSKLLKKELEYLMGSIEIIDVVRKEDINQYKNDVDFIISTIPLDDQDIMDKYIKVNTILTPDDKARIVQKCGIYNPNHSQLVISNQIIEDLSEFIPKNKREQARRKVLARIAQKHIEYNEEERMNKPVLKELIDESKIVFLESVKNWQDSIYKSGKPLLEAGYIEERYLDKVIANVNELGPYIVIAPKIAISHARPEDGVNELGLTLLILEKPVVFHSKDMDKDVQVIVTLAAPDNEKHLLALQQLSMLFMESLEELINAKTKQEVLDLVKKYS